MNVSFSRSEALAITTLVAEFVDAQAELDRNLRADTIHGNNWHVWEQEWKRRKEKLNDANE